MRLDIILPSLASIYLHVLCIATLFFCSTAIAGPIHDAAREGDLETLDAALSGGASIQDTDFLTGTALHVAVVAGHPDIVRKLLHAGADPDAASEVDRAPTLHLAAIYGETEIARLLIESGANLNALDSNGNTALHKAVLFKQLEVVNFLVDAGADLEIPEDGNQFTPLLMAVNFSTPDIVRLLVEAGANVEARDNGGRTVLREAATPRAWYAAGSSPVVIEYLIAQGADINAVENNGLSILGNLRARYLEYEKEEMIKVFERHGAR